MKIIDALGKPCPIPVIEAKKALNAPNVNCILVKVDNIVATQNLEKMALGYNFEFHCTEKAGGLFEVAISKPGGQAGTHNEEVGTHGGLPGTHGGLPDTHVGQVGTHGMKPDGQVANGDIRSSDDLVVVISRNTMGEGKEDLGRILIKGFIYSLTELPVPPKFVIFINSGAFLTASDSNTIDDLKKLEQRGAGILTCGTCINYYGLREEPAVGNVTDMYGITEKMASARGVINI